MSDKLSFICVDAIANGHRLPTFQEVRALAQELLEQRHNSAVLAKALHMAESDLVAQREASRALIGRERVWRSYLEPETWTMLDRLARTNNYAEHVDAGEA